MTDWSFRYRLTLGEESRIHASDHEVFLTRIDDANPVVVRSRRGGPIDATRDLVLRSWGYESHELAYSQAQRWRSALTIGFAAHNLGADFGQRTPPFGIDPVYTAAQATDDNPVVMEDQHALVIFQTNPLPRFLHFNVGSVTIGKNWSLLHHSIQLALREGHQLNEWQHLAFSTYTSSLGQNPDARLVTLVSAVELLIEPQPRDAQAQAVVDELVAVVEASGLPQSEKDSMRGALSGMRCESIGQAAKTLTATVGDRHYMGQSAPKFFARCYELRSQLVHGYALPDFDEVNQRGAELERLVGDLIAVSIVDRVGITPEFTLVGAHPSPAWDGDPAAIPLEGDAVRWSSKRGEGNAV